SLHLQRTPAACPPTTSAPTPITAQNNSPPAALAGVRPVWPAPHNTIPAIVAARYWAYAPAPLPKKDSPRSAHTTAPTPSPHSITPTPSLAVCLSAAYG